MHKPTHYENIGKRYPSFLSAVENLGQTSRVEGPLGDKEVNLIQLAAAASIRSEGAVHSHVRRAQEAGATAEEIHQALLALTCTIGFPSVMAALSWADDILQGDAQWEL